MKNPETTGGLNRRQFLKTVAVTAGASCQWLPSRVLAAPGRLGANDRMVIAHIGTGGMGMTHVRNMTRFRAEGKVDIAAVCDVDVVKARVEWAYNCPVAGILPHSDEMMALASEGLFVLHYPNHPLTERIREIAARMEA